MVWNLTKSVSHLLIWDHLPSLEEKHRFRYELALASRDIPESVVDVIGSLLQDVSNLDIPRANTEIQRLTCL